jgi:hypothetical protein
MINMNNSITPKELDKLQNEFRAMSLGILSVLNLSGLKVETIQGMLKDTIDETSIIYEDNRPTIQELFKMVKEKVQNE